MACGRTGHNAGHWKFCVAAARPGPVKLVCYMTKISVRNFIYVTYTFVDITFIHSFGLGGWSLFCHPIQPNPLYSFLHSQRQTDGHSETLNKCMGRTCLTYFTYLYRLTFYHRIPVWAMDHWTNKDVGCLVYIFCCCYNICGCCCAVLFVVVFWVF